jgi:tRNA threonylcarbamoyl adenosine modification protein YeaZ
VALRKGDTVFSEIQTMTRGHAEALMPMMARVCAEAEVAFENLERLAVTVGPGTFTGVRVGLSAMRGLALALDIPVCSIGTLHAMAAVHAGETPLIISVDARRDTYYTQSFDASGQFLDAPQALSLAQVVGLHPDQTLAVAGSGAAHVQAAGGARFQLAEIADYPDAVQVLHLAEALSDQDWAAQSRHPGPLYLRPPDATLPNPDKQLRRQSDADA